ncbi:MAG: MMPL family transporter [Pseudohongiella sp.]|nr:MMPL family transporter [Pseudohongiella sp.]
MENRLLVLARLFAAAPGFVVRHRILILAIVVLISIFQALGVATRTRIDISTDSMIDQTDPAIAALNAFRTQFGSDDSLFLVYEARDGDIFSARSLAAARALTESLRDWRTLDASRYDADLQELDQIRRVQSITTLRVQRVDGDTLRSERLVPDIIPDDPAQLAVIRAQALAEDDYRLAFYSEDGRFGALLIQTTFGARPLEGYVPAVNADDISLDDAFSNFGGDGGFELTFDEQATIDEVSFELVDMAEYKQFFTAISAVLEDYQSDFEFYPAGNPSLMSWVFDVLQELLWLAAGVVAIFIFLLRALFRSFSAVFWPIITILLSLLWSWGITVWVGATLSTMLSLTVMLVFAVGIADCVHVMSAYFVFREQGHDHAASLSKAYEKTGLAILVTTITTMAGVLALTGSELIPIQVFGFMSALGVFMALVFTVVLLPILLSIWHPAPAKAPGASLSARWLMRWQALPFLGQTALIVLLIGMLFTAAGVAIGFYICLTGLITLAVLRWQSNILAACPDWAQRRTGTLLGVFALIFGASVYGTSLVKIDSNVAELARETSAPRIAYNMVDEHMAGAQTISVMIDTGASDGLLEPAVLKAMEALQLVVAERYATQISRTFSLANIVKDTNQVMNQDDPAFYRIPDDAVTVSQLMYLFNSANPEERRSLVSDDFSRSHITLNSYNAGSYEYQQVMSELDAEIARIFAPVSTMFPDLQVTVTGSVPMMMRAMDEIAQSQYSSLLLALTVISAIMIITLGSVQAGLISIIPNLIPALMTFGLMGLLGISLDVDTLLIAPVIIGIAVDDTIHFMTSYRLELIKTRSMPQALKNTVQDVGRAVMFTTMILGLGFAILGFSEYLGIAKVGIFGGLAILVALLCDLFLLPALIIKLQPRFGIKGDLESFSDAAQSTITAPGNPSGRS